MSLTLTDCCGIHCEHGEFRQHLDGAADIAGLPADLAHGQRPQTRKNNAGGDDGDHRDFRRQGKPDRHRSTDATRKKGEQGAAFSGPSRAD